MDVAGQPVVDHTEHRRTQALEFLVVEAALDREHLVGADVISIQADGGVSLGNLLRNSGWIEWVTEEDGVINVGVKNGERRVPEIVLAAHQAGITIKSISVHEPNLEDVFLKFTGKKIREDEGDAKQHLRRMVRAIRRKR